MLAEWLKRQPKGTGIRMIRSGIHAVYVYGARPKQVKSLELAKRIVEYTNGEVTFEDLCEPVKPAGSE